MIENGKHFSCGIEVLFIDSKKQEETHLRKSDSVHRRALLMCECKRAVRFCVSVPRFCQVKLLSSNLLCFSVGVSHGWVILSLPIFPSSAFLLSWHSFPNSCPVSFSHLSSLSLSHIQESTFLQSVRNAVSGAYGMCHMNQYFCC